MILSKLDLFSSPFSFNTGDHQMKRGTLVGTLLTFSILATTFAYFVYMIKLYLTNQIDPTFRSQSLISQDLIQIQPNSDLVGFRFEIGDQQQIKPDKTYLVYYAFFQYISPDNSFLLPLNVIDCINPNLQGFKCLDFSSIKNQTLLVDTSKNMRSQIEIFTYGCRDIDQLKTTVPDNCAEQKDIDNLINGINSVLRLKLFTSQFNTVTQSMDVNYRNAYVFTIANQAILTQIKTQTQQTLVKQGLFIQTQSSYSSPIQYTQSDQGYDRQYALQEIGGGAYSSVTIFMDEIIQHIYIQYPTIPQIIALVSSIFTLLMFVGFVGRTISQNSIRSDFLMLFLKNRYQGNYLEILKNSNYLSQDQEVQSKQDDEISEGQMQFNEQETNGFFVEYPNQKKISIPFMSTKKKEYLENYQSNNSNNQNEGNLVSQNNDNLFIKQDQQLQTPQQNITIDFNLEESKNQKNNLCELNSTQLQGKIPAINQQQYDLSYEAFQSDILKKLSIPKGREPIKLKSKNSNFQQNKEKQKLIYNLKALKDQNCSQKEKNERSQQHLAQIIRILDKIRHEHIQLYRRHHIAQKGDNDVAIQRIAGSPQAQKKEDLSHYEIQSSIARSENLQDHYIQQFLQKCFDDEDMSEVDKRIITSIKKWNIN